MPRTLITIIIFSALSTLMACKQMDATHAGPTGSGELPRSPHARLIALMPDTIESVMITDWSRLIAEDAPDPIYKALYETRVQDFTRLGWPNNDADARELIMGLATKAGLETEAWGGSHFMVPADIGTGDFNQRQILITREPMTELREAFEQARSINPPPRHIDINGHPAFRAMARPLGDVDGKTNPPNEEIFLAFPDDRTLLIAESRADLAQMLNNWHDTEARVPTRFGRILANADPQAPMLVLRNIPAGEHAYEVPESVTAFAMWLSIDDDQCMHEVWHTPHAQPVLEEASQWVRVLRERKGDQWQEGSASATLSDDGQRVEFKTCQSAIQAGGGWYPLLVSYVKFGYLMAF